MDEKTRAEIWDAFFKEEGEFAGDSCSYQFDDLIDITVKDCKDRFLSLLDAKISDCVKADSESNSQMIEKHEPGTIPLGKTLKDRQGWCVGCMRIVMLRELRSEIAAMEVEGK